MSYIIWVLSAAPRRYSGGPINDEKQSGILSRAVFRAQSVELEPSRAFLLKARRAFQIKKLGSARKLDLRGKKSLKKARFLVPNRKKMVPNHKSRAFVELFKKARARLDFLL